MRSVLFAALIVSFPAIAVAHVPLTDSAIAIGANPQRLELRFEAGGDWRFGGFAGFRMSADAPSLGVTAARVLRRDERAELRLRARLGATYFEDPPSGFAWNAEVGLPTLVEFEAVGFWVGPSLDSAWAGDGLGGRVSPMLDAGMRIGTEGLPQLWTSGALGYSFATLGGGAARAEWLIGLSLGW